MPYARTLVEAYLYISLTVPAEDIDAAEARDYRALTSLTEGQDAWTLRYEESGHRIELQVRYETEADAREGALRFGLGVSELIDAGQWLQVSAAYGRRALREGLFFTQDPTDEHFQSVVLGWGFARDAAVEALKFVPTDVDEIPSSAVWTEMGTSAYLQSPDRFSRKRLLSDIAFYEKSADDFRRLHGNRDG